MKSINNVWRNFFLVILTGIVLFQTACKKLVNVSAPVTSTNSINVYESDATAAAVLTGIYGELNSNFTWAGGLPSISLFAGLSSDEFALFGGVSGPINYYYSNSLTSLNTGSTDFWENIYPYVYYVNSAISGINGSTSLTPAVKQQLLGEAKFLRAFFYFYLVNIYGDVPLVLTTDYKTNAQFARTPQKSVYQQIISDLYDAQSLLSSNYLDATLLASTQERVRPTKWAATAMLARAFIYTQNWDSAAIEATEIINNSQQFGLDTLNGVFLKNSSEAIWQLQPVSIGITNTHDAYMFIIPSTGLNSINCVYLSTNLLNAFENGDSRRTNWIDSVSVNGQTYYYPYKYKVNTLNAPVSEYEMVLRLGEQYLIRAEAEAQDPNLGDAITDLNTIRQRAGLAPYAGGIGQSLLDAITHERQVELFTEWGHRWLDLKRTGTVDAVMSVVTPQKGGTWNTDWGWYPIPETELIADPHLVQNIGY